MCYANTHIYSEYVFYQMQNNCAFQGKENSKKVPNNLFDLYKVHGKFMRLVESINHIMSAEEVIWYNIDRSQKRKQRIQPFIGLIRTLYLWKVVLYNFIILFSM